MICASSSPLASLCNPATLPLSSCLMKQVNCSVPLSRGMVKFRRRLLFSLYPGGHLARASLLSLLICCWSTTISASSPSTFSLWTSSLILMVLASPLMMDWNWYGDGLGVAVRTFCMEVGERGNPQESVVVRAILALSLVRSHACRESFAPRLRCPGKHLVVCSGDEMCIGMGRGAEDATVARESLHGRSVADIADGPQVW